MLLAEAHHGRAVQSPIPSSGCPGLPGEHVAVGGMCTSQFPARLGPPSPPHRAGACPALGSRRLCREPRQIDGVR